MKPFDLEAAKRGEPVCTADGHLCRRVIHVPEATELDGPVLVITSHGYCRWVCSDGTLGNEPFVFMAPRKRKGWVCVGYSDGPNSQVWVEHDGFVYETETELNKNKPIGAFVGTIEWEE